MDSAPESQLHRPMPRRSRAWLAVSLTLLCPGWGHLYVGAVARGLLVALLNLAVIVPGVVWLWVVWAQGPTTALVAMGVTLAFLIALPADAAHCALREPGASGRRSSPVRVVVLHGLFVPIAVTMLHTELSWIRANRVQPFQTPTESMVPTLLPGDFFFVDTRPSHARRAAPGRHHRLRPPPPARASPTRSAWWPLPESRRRASSRRGSWSVGSCARIPSQGAWQRLRTEHLAGTPLQRLPGVAGRAREPSARCRCPRATSSCSATAAPTAATAASSAPPPRARARPRGAHLLVLGRGRAPRALEPPRSRARARGDARV